MSRSFVKLPLEFNGPTIVAPKYMKILADKYDKEILEGILKKLTFGATTEEMKRAIYDTLVSLFLELERQQKAQTDENSQEG